jgi:hypothetical protein
MIRVFDVPVAKERFYFEAVERAVGLLHDVVEAELDDAAVADVARFYVEARNRWEQSREWRAAVKFCRD